MKWMLKSAGVTAAALLWLAGAAPAEPPAEQDAPNKDEPKKDAPQPQPDAPDLDELLGIKPSSAGNTGIPDPARADLDKRLSAEEIGDLFESAVSLMGDAAKRLSTAVETARAKPGTGGTRSPEAGLATQRVQEDVVRKLDALIAQLEQQGGGQQQRSRQQGPQDPSQPQGQQRSQPSPGQNGDGRRNDEGPPGRPGELRPELDAARAAWGALPARVRDMLQQGSGDKYSSLYERLTADYYKRLAEQGRTRGAGSGDHTP